MKKILIILIFLSGFIANAQVLGYSDLGLLFSTEDNQGTARTMAMKGAFGALGGDLSATSINPASGAVFTNSIASFTLGYSQKDILSEFYGNQNQSSQADLNISQAGGLFIFDNDFQNKGIQKVAIGINYNIINDFKNSWMANGVASPTWEEDPIDSALNYSNVDLQEYKNFTSGKLTKLNFNIAAQYNDNLYIGASLTTYETNFIEESTRQELANDGNGNSIDAFESFWQEVQGSGFSMGIGFIIKASQNLRFGLSYNSPIWYELHEESNLFAEYNDDLVGYYNLIYSNDPLPYENNINKILGYDYKLRTPSKLTGSFAYVFDKKGLISVDITRKNYKGISLSPDAEFDIDNNNFDTLLTDAYKLNLGTEWRFDELSARAGYSYEQSPFIDAFDSDKLVGYSVGIGYDFGNFTIDVAYDQSEKTDFYDFYPEFDFINGTELTRSNNKVLATLTINL